MTFHLLAAGLLLRVNEGAGEEDCEKPYSADPALYEWSGKTKASSPDAVMHVYLLLPVLLFGGLSEIAKRLLQIKQILNSKHSFCLESSMVIRLNQGRFFFYDILTFLNVVPWLKKRTNKRRRYSL